MPTPPAIDLSGRWTGSVTVLNMSAQMTWTLTQASGSVTGPVLLGLSNGTVLLNGFLTGTLSGSSLTSTISVSPGGIPTQPNCSGQIAGTMTASIGVTSTLSGSLAVTSSNCTTQPLPSGTVTLTRQ
jgi:hypothetical protein